AELRRRQIAAGYSIEELEAILHPMVEDAKEPVGSMGDDTPAAVLSERYRPMSHFFRQNFSQVTNPPIDSLREHRVMSLKTRFGNLKNVLDQDSSQTEILTLESPFVSNGQFAAMKAAFGDSVKEIACLFPASSAPGALREGLDRIRSRAEEAVRAGVSHLILTDEGVDEANAAMPMILATSAVHSWLTEKGLRTFCSINVRSAECLDPHYFAVLIGCGATTVNAYLAQESIAERIERGLLDGPLPAAVARYREAIDQGLLKIMSKMGISVISSYRGGLNFEAVGLSRAMVNEYFPGMLSRISGIGLTGLQAKALDIHARAFRGGPAVLPIGGLYKLRAQGETHAWGARLMHLMQSACASGDYDQWKRYSQGMQGRPPIHLRDLLDFKSRRSPAPIDEVESITSIRKRFVTPGMSLGALSPEAHKTLNIAMNRIGAKSDSGEGGEDPRHFQPMPNGDNASAKIKQVASGRFGVTAEYLNHCEELEIKVAQGAKPGEGGQLPGHKVNKQIARVRHSTPGVGLISPPPHHDIYSIEDLAQLIHDLKNVNPKARISVKLVSEVGVGTVAAGVSKAHADHVTISGFDGGTGASPLTSTKHAGSCWEIGLAETHQTLVLNRLRSRICVQVDGGMRTGRDVAIGALLGADEFGFATAPLIAEGCLMMRKCHLNTCPVGVATQDPELRKRFMGKPEHVINYFFFVAEELRQIMAKLGFRSVEEMIGQVDRLDMRRAVDHWKARGLDYSRLLAKPEAAPGDKVYNCEEQDHGLEQALDNQLIQQAQSALESGEAVQIEVDIHNYNRSLGAMLSGRVAEKYGFAGLPDDTIHIKAFGTAGQSLGAWLARGVTLELAGEGNDYVGKGLSGGHIIIYPPEDSAIGKAEDNIIVGNTVLYGAIAGECYFRGVAGERFAVRNSGATAVVEGVGDHGCEYMTGGVVVVLGGTGRNFAAGMSGGIAYVLDEEGNFEQRCNMAQVELEPIKEEDDALERLEHLGGDLETKGRVDVSHDMTRFDAIRLRQIIENHLRYTNSAVARKILDDWDRYLGRFVKVMPLEYRRALQEMQAEQEAVRAAG
ncbi:glutamate synthase large subunit, partial [Thiolapillus sp.]